MITLPELSFAFNLFSKKEWHMKSLINTLALLSFFTPSIVFSMGDEKELGSGGGRPGQQYEEKRGSKASRGYGYGHHSEPYAQRHGRGYSHHSEPCSAGYGGGYGYHSEPRYGGGYGYHSEPRYGGGYGYQSEPYGPGYTYHSH